MAPAAKKQPSTGLQLSGYLYYHEELQILKLYLSHLPETIPAGQAHNFIDYIHDEERATDLGADQCALNAALEVSFGSRANDTVISFKSRGPHLDAVVAVIRRYLKGSGGENVLLIKWVDDLTRAAVAAFEAAGVPLPRKSRPTTKKRGIEEEAAEKQAAKHRKTAEGVEKRRRDEAGEELKKLTKKEVNWDPADLEDFEFSTSASAKVKQGAPTNTLLDNLTIPCRTISGKKRRERCVGAECYESWAHPRNSSRILKHAVDCPGLSVELQDDAKRALSKGALSTVIEEQAAKKEQKDVWAGFKEQGMVNKKDAAVLRKTENNLFSYLEL